MKSRKEKQNRIIRTAKVKSFASLTSISHWLLCVFFKSSELKYNCDDASLQLRRCLWENPIVVSYNFNFP